MDTFETEPFRLSGAERPWRDQPHDRPTDQDPSGLHLPDRGAVLPDRRRGGDGAEVTTGHVGAPAHRAAQAELNERTRGYLVALVRLASERRSRGLPARLELDTRFRGFTKAELGQAIVHLEREVARSTMIARQTWEALKDAQARLRAIDKLARRVVS